MLESLLEVMRWLFAIAGGVAIGGAALGDRPPDELGAVGGGLLMLALLLTQRRGERMGKAEPTTMTGLVGMALVLLLLARLSRAIASQDIAGIELTADRIAGDIQEVRSTVNQVESTVNQVESTVDQVESTVDQVDRNVRYLENACRR